MSRIIIHQLYNSGKYVPCKVIKKLMADLKFVYTAVDDTAALSALDDFEEIWGRNIPGLQHPGGKTGPI